MSVLQNPQKGRPWFVAMCNQKKPSNGVMFYLRPLKFSRFCVSQCANMKDAPAR